MDDLARKLAGLEGVDYETRSGILDGLLEHLTLLIDTAEMEIRAKRMQMQEWKRARAEIRKVLK